MPDERDTEATPRDTAVSDEDASGPTAASAPGGVSGESRGLEPGDHVGDLIVLRVLGEGGMGVVFGAYDPSLDRQVAVKLLRIQENRDATIARGRMMREAQAMAKLSHPNVLPVYEVGTHEGQVFVVMELVDGPTLLDWLRAERRDWPEIVACLREAGRGLEAAHAAQLVHRDFKPENVLIGSDGRPRVADFGIAGVSAGSDGATTAERADAVERELSKIRSGSALETDLTRTGMVIGTPIYMAPEQLAGQRVDGRADQFAFCVVLWEALYGKRPFGDSLPEHIEGISGRAPLAEPPPSDVPRRVKEALKTGLALHPDDRHPSMEALLARLEDPAPSGPPWLAVGLGAAAVVVALVAGVVFTREADPCPPPALAGTWDERTRASIGAAFRDSDLPFAESTLEATLGALDAYAEEWSEVHVDACRATAVRHEQSPHLLDLRMHCLDRRRADLAALARTLADADAPVVERALSSASGLPSIAACADRTALLASAPLPRDPARRAAIEEVRRALSSARASLATGRASAGLEGVAPLDARVAELDYPPLTAEATVLRASLEYESGDVERAVATYEDGMLAAAAAHEDDLLLHAASRRAGILALHLGRVDETLAQRALLESLARRTADPVLRAAAWSRIAVAVDRSGDSERAVALQRRVVDALTESVGEDDTRTAGAINNLGSFLKNTGDLDGALRHYLRSLRINERLLGESHPSLTYTLGGMGGVFAMRGEYEAALEHQQRALSILRETRGEEHPDAGDTRWYVADSLTRLRRTEEAIDQASRSVATLRGFEGPRLAHALLALADARAAAGELPEARASLAEAIAMLIASVGADHPDTAKARRELAEVHLALGEAAEARAVLEPALRTLEVAHTEPRWLYEAMLTRGALERAEGAPDAARATYDRILEEASARLGEADLTVLRALVARAELDASSDHATRAHRDLERGLELLAERDPGVRGRALIASARAHLLLGQRSLARERAREAIEILERGDVRDRRRAAPGLGAVLASLQVEVPSWAR